MIPLQSTPPIPEQSTPVFRWKGYQLFRCKVRLSISSERSNHHQYDAADWAKMLEEEVLATAILDRLLFRCEVISFTGKDYRIGIENNIWQLTKEIYFCKPVHSCYQKLCTPDYQCLCTVIYPLHSSMKKQLTQMNIIS